ncbi:MAG: propanediol utilization protein [Bacilli bacterium]|nr:propanediol utilization protein [Bacilli bacterium]
MSNRHVHLTKEVYIQLFGDDVIEIDRILDQPTQFASKSFVTIKYEEKEISKVRVLGPFRDYNQIEISRTDAYYLGANPPIKSSGDLDNSLPITLIGPKGKVNLDKGLILANRHIHITPNDILKYNLEGIEKVCIKVDGQKSGILKNVYIKPDKDAGLRLHLDTDDANAFNINNNDEVEVLIERGKI